MAENIEKIKKKHPVLRWFGVTGIIVFVMITLVVLARLFVFGLYTIPSSSMEPTLAIGDKVFAWRVPFSGNIETGDIVTFEDPNDNERVLIKRVIAEGGDIVDIRDDKLYVNGKLFTEDNARGKTEILAKSNITYPHVVDDGCYWLMGDNREHSSDSRVFGDVDGSTIIGKAVRIYSPESHAMNLE